MNVLGITDGMTGGAAVIVDGKIAAAVSEERLVRKKMAIGFPEKAINEVLSLSGVEVSDIDYIAIAGKRDHFYYPPKVWNGWFQEDRGFLKELVLKIASYFVDLIGDNTFFQWCYYQLKLPYALNRRRKVRKFLKKLWHFKCPIIFIDHHYSHATAAYFTSGFNKATVVSVDGGGDGYSSKIYKVNNGNFTEITGVSSYNSIGNFYAYVTHLCGFKAHKHEGKITGLAAHGNPKYKELLEGFITFKNGTIVNRSRSFYYSSLSKLAKSLPKGFKREDLAGSMQKHLEDVVSKYVHTWVEDSGYSDVALVGGVFANVRLNQEINNLDNVNNVFVFPGMGDEGLAVGAAYALWAEKIKEKGKKALPYKPVNVYFGRGFSNDEIRAELDKENLTYIHYDDIESEIAKLLAEGHVVARFEGDMEYGPRALGHRSILYQATDPTVNDWLNKKLERTEFMPFAPVTLEEYVEKCYKNIKGGLHTARFMTITFDCTEWMQKNCPAVVHIDGTARPQIVNKELDGGYYRIVDEYRKITGLPSIINTSFNMHEEPIVCTPYDAIRAFKLGHLEYLAIGNYLVKSVE